VIDSLVTLTYERLKEEINASHILISLKADASPADTLEAYNKISALRNRALAGEDFSGLATTYSEEPGADVTRGNLGYFTAMQMVFPFEQTAYATAIGGVSEPVRTQFGYHIIKVLDRKPSRGEVEVSHIMLRTGEGASNLNVKNTIFDIYDKLQKGMSWEELCQHYSEDSNSKDKGGRLKPFGVGAMSSIPEFQEMAFSLKEKGQISDPFQTRFGWHILRLESKIPLPPLEEIKVSLTQRVSRDERVQISKQVLRKRMKSEFGYAEDSQVKSKVMALADTILSGGMKTVPVDLEEKVLFTMQNQSYRVKDFLRYAVSHQQPSSIPSKAYLDQLFLQYTDDVHLAILEEKIKIKSPEYKWLLKEYYEGILLFEIMEKEVWNKAMEDTVGLKQYFLAHSGNYNAGERMVGNIYNSSVKENLGQLKKLIELKDPAVQEFVARNSIRHDSGSFEKADRSILSEISWSPGVYPVSTGDMNYLVVIEKILPPGPETFEEARASVISDYQTYLEESWITELKRKFGVKIEKKEKKQAFQQLVIE